jgi:DNA mismatch repair protein MutS2
MCAPSCLCLANLRWVSALLWLAFTQASVRDVVDKQHYSVDMLVAVIATWGVWNALHWVYPQSQPLPERQKGTPADTPNIWVLGLIAFALLAAGVIVIGGKA